MADSAYSHDELFRATYYPGQDKQDLIARCQEGDRQAFDELVARYQRYVFNIIYQHLGPTDQLEDIAQEVFLRIFKFIGSFRREASLESWIYKVTLNYIRSHLRKQSLQRRMLIQERANDDDGPELLERLPATRHADPAETIVPQQIAEQIRKAVYSLKPIYRDVLIMRELQEMSYQEIADILGISIGTVKSRISRARELVREMIGPNVLEFLD